MQIAADTDSTLKSLKNVKAAIQYALRMQSGDTEGNLVEEIQDPSTFSLQYPVTVIDERRGLVPAVTFAHANGKQVSERTNTVTKTYPVPSSKARSAPSDLVQSWPLLGNREIFAGLVDGRKPFSEYIAALLDPKNGYQTQVEERQQVYKGHNVRDYMIVATRTGAPSGVLGPSTISMVIDANIHLPVTITASIHKPGDQREDYMVWNAEWTNNATFKPKDFVLIPPTKASAQPGGQSSLRPPSK